MQDPSRSDRRAGVQNKAFTASIVPSASASRQDAKRVRPKSISLLRPCWVCGYARGSVIFTLQPEHPGLIKCGKCDTFQGVVGQGGGR